MAEKQHGRTWEVFGGLRRLLRLLDPGKRYEFGGVIFLAVFVSLIEMAGLSLVMPFVQVSVDFGKVESSPYYRAVYEWLGFEKPSHFVITFGIFLIGFYILRSAINLYYYYRVARFSQENYRRLALKLFRNFIGFSYRNFVERNSSHLVQAIITEAQNVASMLSSFTLLFGEVAVILLIYTALLVVNWKLTLLLTLFLAINGWVMARTVTRRIKKAGEERAHEHRRFYEILNNSFGNFKMIKLRSEEERTIEHFGEIGRGLSRTVIVSDTISHIPRLFLEALGFIIVILIILYWIVRYDTDVASKMGILSLFILALYRLMPSFNRILSNYNRLVFLSRSLEIVREELGYGRERIGEEEVPFRREIRLEKVSFAYHPERPILQDIDFTVEEGEKVAIVGPSGSGKSTLARLLLRFYDVTDGAILVDGQDIRKVTQESLRKAIGIVPQDTVLFNDTLLFNLQYANPEATLEAIH
jgi:ABC-type multidrug transport system fused ATPase/permease subunit